MSNSRRDNCTFNEPLPPLQARCDDTGVLERPPLVLLMP